MNTNTFHRRVAKRVFWLSNKLEWFKTPQRTWRWLGNADRAARGRNEEFEFAGWAMLPGLSIWLMERSWKLDPHCWDHWAVVHDDCEFVPCAMCNGCACDPKDWDGA